MNINKVIIFGNLTQDPELRQIPNSGTSVVNIGIATNRFWKDQAGEKQQEVEYHNVVFFGKQAELLNQYMKKGSSVFVEGRLRTRSWEQDSVKRYMTEIMAENFQFGPRAQQGTGEYKKQEGTGKEAPNEVAYPNKELNPDDIPF